MSTPNKPAAQTGPDEPLSAEAAALAADDITAANAANAADAGASVSQMTERGPELPAESEMDEFMAQMRATFSSMQAQIDALKAQQAAALAANGEPMATRYANGVRDKVAAVVAAHPDAPQGHFTRIVQAAEKLADQAAALVKSGGPADELEKAGAAVEKFATRLHSRGWAKSIDWSAILDDAELAVEEGLKLAAAA